MALRHTSCGLILASTLPSITGRDGCKNLWRKNTWGPLEVQGLVRLRILSLRRLPSSTESVVRRPPALGVGHPESRVKRHDVGGLAGRVESSRNDSDVLVD